MATDYEAVIGLETHVHLKTRSKMWCGCANAFGAPPNTLVCPVCLGLPGVLPVPNDEALRLTVLTGLLLHSAIPGHARFDRKNYFYPDMPKNYQLTQYALPSTQGGHLDFEFEGEIQRVRLTRAHLEEDVGKSTHFDRHSGVDFNRAGVPLLEIVSEPDLRSPDMAHAYLNALKDLLGQGGISDCDMEKGMVRCDVNVSVRPRGSTELGAKIEIKNMNSFSGVRRALTYEIPRQTAALERGERLIQSTRRWNDEAGITEEMRTKEDAHDYRYFPCPDIMPVEPDDAWLEEVRQRVRERPLERKQRFMRDYGLPAGDAEIFKNDPALGDYFESIAGQTRHPKAVANWVINHLQALLSEANELLASEQAAMGLEAGEMTLLTLADLRFPPEGLLELVELVESGKISNRIAQAVFQKMFATGDSPAAIVERERLVQVSDGDAIEGFCEQVITANPGPVADYRGGKQAALNFLKGQVMKLSKGRANPKVVGETLERLLKG